MKLNYHFNIKWLKLGVIILFSSSLREYSFSQQARELYRVTVNGKDGLIDQTGKIIIEPKYHVILSAGTGWALREFENERKYYITNCQGELIDSTKYEDHGRGLCCTNEPLRLKKDGKWGSLNHDGTEIIPFEYDNIGFFEVGFSLAEKKGVRGILDLSGNFTPVDLEMDVEINNLSEGFFKLTKKTEKGDRYGLYNAHTNKIVLPIKYAYISSIRQGILIIRDGEGDQKWDKVVDLHKGKELISSKPNVYISRSCTRDICTGECNYNFYILKDNNWKYVLNYVKGIDDDTQFAIIDNNENYILEWTDEYSDIEWIGDGFVVKFRKKFGFIVKNKTKVSILNPLGEEVNTFKIKGEIKPFFNGLAAIKIKDKWGFIDTTGAIVIPVKYEVVGEFDQNGIAIIDERIPSEDMFPKWKKGYINKQGEYIWEPSH